jgi:hypothetical protein
LIGRLSVMVCDSVLLKWWVLRFHSILNGVYHLKR